MRYLLMAEKVINGNTLNKNECNEILDCGPNKILELLQAAFIIREKYFGRKVFLHTLINAKSGICSEDCNYCSQSSVSDASVRKYPLLEEKQLVEGAKKATKEGAKRYCIVCSGRSPSENDLKKISMAVKEIKNNMDINICTSIGLLTEGVAVFLKKAGVDRYNHNLNASREYYEKICSTHTFEDRLKTLYNASKAGMELCSGALFGMGENNNDIVQTILALRELSPDSIPINFLHPVPGTPIDVSKLPSPLKCLAVLCLVRFLNPDKEIRAAGGREYNLKSVQAFALYPANSIFVNGYLTTEGQSPEDARNMIKDVGFEVEEEKSMEIASENS